MNFDIKTEQLSDNAYVISLAGEVDLYTAPEFKQQLLEVIAQGANEVIVDLSSTTFIDSTTLGVLVGGVKAWAERLCASSWACCASFWYVVASDVYCDASSPSAFWSFGRRAV